MAAGLSTSGETPLAARLKSAFQARDADTTRTAAFDRFMKSGLPHRRLEGWRWSDIYAALRTFEPANDVAAPILPSRFEGVNPIEIQVVNGRIIKPTEELPEGVQIGVMPAAATIPDLEDHAVVSLTVAMVEHAIGITVPAGMKLDRPILIRHILQRGGMAFAQTLARIGEGADATIIETYEDFGGGAGGFYAHLFHIDVRSEAVLKRRVLQSTDAGSVVHGMFAAKVEGGARLEQTGLSTGGRLSRHETLVHYMDEKASADINSAALVDGDRHADFTSKVLHLGPGCVTRQTHKGVARDKGRAVFQGKFDVQRAAQQTDAQMSANALLLSDTAEANHKPELEIYADDVECAHGSTSGALDDDAMFYLRQRGLDEATARALLIEAFLGEALDGLGDEEGDVFRQVVADWLSGAGA